MIKHHHRILNLIKDISMFTSNGKNLAMETDISWPMEPANNTFFCIFKLPTSFLLSNPPLIAVLHFGISQINYQRISNVMNRNYIQLYSYALKPQCLSSSPTNIFKLLNFFITFIF